MRRSTATPGGRFTCLGWRAVARQETLLLSGRSEPEATSVDFPNSDEIGMILRMGLVSSCRWPQMPSPTPHMIAAGDRTALAHFVTPMNSAPSGQGGFMMGNAVGPEEVRADEANSAPRN